MGKRKGLVAGAPRRFRMRTDRADSVPCTARRKAAGDAWPAEAVDRHRQAKTLRPSTANCRRRSRCGSMAGTDQARMAENPSLASNCSRLHRKSCPGRTITRRSSAIPAADQAGAKGRKGGANRASQLPLADRRASEGNNRLSSPHPCCSVRISVRQPCGQPPPGNSASSSGKPLGKTPSGRLARPLPRQTSPRARTSSRATGEASALTTSG